MFCYRHNLKQFSQLVFNRLFQFLWIVVGLKGYFVLFLETWKLHPQNKDVSNKKSPEAQGNDGKLLAHAFKSFYICMQ